MGRLEGKAAFVTGAGRGLGRATALALAREGAIVGIADIDGETLAGVLAELRAEKRQARAFPIDVGNRDALLGSVGQFAHEFGRLDAMVSNAMWIRYEPLSEIRDAVLDRMLSVGLKAVIWGAQAAAALMDEQRGGAIVNFASPAADSGMRNTAVYTAIKGGVVSLTRQMAVELGPRKIRVNAVAPGAVPTPGARAIVDAAGYEARRQRTPLQRLGEPEDIAAAVTFLVSDEASFVTGEVLHVDGGISISGP